MPCVLEVSRAIARESQSFLTVLVSRRKLPPQISLFPTKSIAFPHNSSKETFQLGTSVSIYALNFSIGFLQQRWFISYRMDEHRLFFLERQQ